MVKEALPEGRRTDRRSYLKKLTLGILGIGALLSLRDVPKAGAANTYLTLGDTKVNNDAGANSTGMQSSTLSSNGTLYVENTGPAPGVKGYSDSGSGIFGESVTGTGTRGRSSNGKAIWGTALAPKALPMVAQGSIDQVASLQEWWNSDETPLAVVDATGQLGIGTSTPLTPLHIKSSSSNPALRIENEKSHVGAFIYCYSSSHIPFFSGRRARGTMASPAAVQAGDALMRYGGSGYGTSGFPGGNRAILAFCAAEAWTDSAQGAYITMSTTPTGSNVTAERVQIDDAGNLLPMSDNAYNCGDDKHRWKLLRAQTVTSGDLTFENGGRVTEDEEAGLAFKNPDGEKIAALDWNGNFHIKGKVMEDL